MEVGDSVVSVVLRLPPAHTEADLCTDGERPKVVIEPVFEDLVMCEVVSKPPALLPEYSYKESSSDGRKERVWCPCKDGPSSCEYA